MADFSTVAQYAPRETLRDLVNVPYFDDEKWPVKAGEFLQRHGELFPGADSPLKGSEVPEYAKRFRLAWEAKKDPSLIPVVNSLLNEIFGPSGPKQVKPYRGTPAVFSADFETGKWSPRPRTLLDLLAIELMRSRKALHRCENPDCRRHPYFVKAYSREKYCSVLCGESGRVASLERYNEKHREERNAKRRKSKTVRR